MKRQHWGEKFNLAEALQIAKIVDYEPEPDAHDKSDFVLGLACYLIKNPYPYRAEHGAEVLDFLRQARSAANMAQRVEMEEQEERERDDRRMEAESQWRWAEHQEEERQRWAAGRTQRKEEI